MRLNKFYLFNDIQHTFHSIMVTVATFYTSLPSGSSNSLSLSFII